ncbi:MAG: TolC family protein [Acidobacteriota bacterium]|nr:TolC family protein [Acidobacteriota bacterium]
MRLSLDDAVNRALQSRASLKAEAERINVAKGFRRQAQLIANPEFQFQNENLRPGQTYGRDVDTLALINQPLDILGKRRARIAAAGEAVDRAGADYAQARWQVSQRVKLAYWSARGAQEIHEVLRTTAGNFQKIVDYHVAQLSVGAIAEQDLLRIRLEHERLKISADLAAIEENRARVELLHEMGAADFPELVLTEPWTAASTPIRPDVADVIARRADVHAARAALEQARAAAHLQDVAARPDLNITYGYKRTQLPDTTDGVNTAIASVRITLPFTDKNQGNRVAAEAEVRRAEQQFSAVETDARAEYYGALREYQMRQEEFETMLQPLREHAGAIAQIASAAYAEGGTDLLRLLDAERARLDAELAWTRGMIEYRQSLVRLEAAEGVNP